MGVCHQLFEHDFQSNAAAVAVPVPVLFAVILLVAREPRGHTVYELFAIGSSGTFSGYVLIPKAKGVYRTDAFVSGDKIAFAPMTIGTMVSGEKGLRRVGGGELVA